MLISELIINYDENLTTRFINYLDSEIKNNYDLISSMSDDDRTTYVDDFLEHTEYIIGMGFVVIQYYMTVICGNLNKKKYECLSRGPEHKSGESFAKIVNCSANYWKHHNDWLSDKQKNCRYEKRSNKFFSTVLYKNTSHDLDHRLYLMLNEISDDKTKQLSNVFDKILEWKKDLLGDSIKS